MEKTFTEKDSLNLINEMILQARNNFRKDSATAIIVSGYSVAAVAILNFVLLHVIEPSYLSFHVWWLMIILWLVTIYINHSKDKQTLVKTHIDRIISNVWRGFALSVVVLMATIFGIAFATNNWSIALGITPAILILTGFAQYITGIVCRFRPYVSGGCVFWLGALATVGSYFLNMAELQFIILAVCMILGFVVPGHLINKKAKENV
ncbi:putative membrane protein [Dysgonomonas sp. PH5-45]|uniref:hypothetical protein n=1 Tax=unclassified Dysgonomonas TaxID=2630389 RepID=UPI002473C020|nr:MULTISPECIES: hypothetical protein [unclassified Dysgonomonas]MDH6355932.1 putative membrane protein [Dysgonomonas sp. PH5-45]MDH6388827.1 putative membrane protein [Dysgonomonas sp. PH5-37]